MHIILLIAFIAWLTWYGMRKDEPIGGFVPDHDEIMAEEFINNY